MIISHTYKFIFIKTQKTAGTSLEIGLSKFCGPRDVVTPIVPEDEAIRRSLGYPGPRNYLLPFSRYRPNDWINLLIRRKGRLRFFNHIDARETRRLVDASVWNSYFKFCFERNPWDKVVSMYYWRNRSEPRPTLSEYIQSGRANVASVKGGFDLYSIDGEIAVDRVCRYECLQQELEFITERVGLPEVPQLPKAKGTVRVDHRHYRDLLSPADREKVARVFAREIAHFGYQY